MDSLKPISAATRFPSIQLKITIVNVSNKNIKIENQQCKCSVNLFVPFF